MVAWEHGNKARKEKYNVRASILSWGVEWGKILEIIGLNESFELYLGLAWQGQVSSYVTPRAIRDLI